MYGKNEIHVSDPVTENAIESDSVNIYTNKYSNYVSNGPVHRIIITNYVPGIPVPSLTSHIALFMLTPI